MTKFICKTLTLIVVIAVALSTVPAYAGHNGVYPKLIIDDYIVEDDFMTPGSSSIITITITNTNDSRYVRNVKFSFSDSSNEIIPVKTSSAFCSYIDPEETYIWEIEVYALETAEDKPHALDITMEYEDYRGSQITSKEVIIVDVIQPVKLSYSEPEFPQKVTEGDTFSFSMDLINMGKTDIYNVLLTFDIENITTGSSVFVGTIEEGKSSESKTNFRVDSDVAGDVSGSVTLSYEDSRGRVYEVNLPISTYIQEKVVAAPASEIDNTDALSEILLRWKIIVYICIALTIVMSVVTIVIAVKTNKQKREYEKKL